MSIATEVARLKEAGEGPTLRLVTYKWSWLALATFRTCFPQHTKSVRADQALQDADLMLVLTEWAEFRDLDPASLSQVRRRIVIDGRNCLDPQAWREAGWEYTGLGR